MALTANMKEQLKQVDSTHVFFTDLNGRPRSVSVNAEMIDAMMERGVNFDGSSTAGIAPVEHSDRLLLPVAETLRILEFADGRTAFFIGQINNERGLRSQSDPRAVLERVLHEAETEFGFRFLAGPEYEFFLLKGDEFKEDVHTDKAGYFHSTPHDKGDAVRKRIVDVLRKGGIRFEKSHHEVTPSQHEINLEAADPLWAADRTLLFVHVTQRVAAEFGYHSTFMPKPFNNHNRNAFHIHLSMHDRNGKNAFYEAGSEHNLSRNARHFIAGILKYARQTSIIMASTYNSYKAYVKEREAPIIRGWGLRNRTSMVRVPYAVSPDSTRIELRSPDAAGNVYLQMATLIAMGLQGLREGRDCGKPDSGSTYHRNHSLRVWDTRMLPKCMFEALAEAEKSRFLKTLLGPKIYKNYMALKISDWEEHRTHVTPMEHAKYLVI